MTLRSKWLNVLSVLLRVCVCMCVCVCIYMGRGISMYIISAQGDYLLSRMVRKFKEEMERITGSD